MTPSQLEIRIGDFVVVEWKGITPSGAPPFMGTVKELRWGPLAVDGLVELPDGSQRVFASDVHFVSKVQTLINEQPCGCHDDPTYGHVIMGGCPFHD